jgi:F-box protein 39
VFYLKNVWRNFRIVDDTLCRQKFNYYSGWQPVLDCLRAQQCLTRVGQFIKGIEIVPTYNFNNISQFMTLLTFNVQQSRREHCDGTYYDVGRRIESFKYLFPCNMASNEQDIKLYGTGGQLLKTLKALLFELHNLKKLKLIDLMLERYDAKHLLDEVLESCNMVLQHLVLVNVTNTHCPIMHVGLFFNLKVLIISPQNLDDDVLQLLASTSLRHLHILQNNFCPITPAACSEKAWKSFRRDNAKVKVHLRAERLSSSAGVADLTLQPFAPVHSVIFRSPKAQISPTRLISIVDMYKYTLTTFGHEMLPDFESPKAFDERIDSLLLLMARQCPNLTNLTVREAVSTSTLLLLAKTAINLCVLNVRKRAVIHKMDWPKNQDWTEEFYQWLQISSRSCESTEREISQILRCRWTMLSDECFEKLEIHLPGFVL